MYCYVNLFLYFNHNFHHNKITVIGYKCLTCISGNYYLNKISLYRKSYFDLKEF